MTLHYWQLYASQQTDLLLVGASLNRDLAKIQEWWITRALNLIFTRLRLSSLVDPELWTISMVTSCLWFLSELVPTSTTFGVKFDSKLTLEDHMRGIVCRVSQRVGILRLVKRIFVDTSEVLRCYFAFFLKFLEYCPPVWGSAGECHL